MEGSIGSRPAAGRGGRPPGGAAPEAKAVPPVEAVIVRPPAGRGVKKEKVPTTKAKAKAKVTPLSGAPFVDKRLYDEDDVVNPAVREPSAEDSELSYAGRTQGSRYEEDEMFTPVARESVAEDSELSYSGRFGDTESPRQVAEDSELSYAGRTADRPKGPMTHEEEMALPSVLVDLPELEVDAPPVEQIKALAPELDPAQMKEKNPALSRLEEDMGPDLDKIGDVFAKGFGPEEAAQIKAATQEIKEGGPGKLERLLNGVLNLGVYASEMKSRSLAGILRATENFFTDKGSKANRLLESTRERYEKQAESASRLMDDRLRMRTLGDKLKIGMKVISVLSWGRVISNTFTVLKTGKMAAVNPYALATLGVLGLGGGAGIVKEARFKGMNLERGKDRSEDVDAAEDEARSIYNEAKLAAGGQELNATDLARAFETRMPKALLERLKDTPDGLASYFSAKVLERDLKGGIQGIQNKLDAIDNNPKLNEQQKALKRRQVASSYEGFIRDADRALSKAGGLDGLAYGASLVESASKKALWVLMASSLSRLFTDAHAPAEKHFEGGTSTGAGPTPGEHPAADHEVMTAESRQPAEGLHEAIQSRGIAGGAASTEAFPGAHFMKVKAGSSISGLLEADMKGMKGAHERAYQDVTEGGYWKKGGSMDYQLTTQAVKDGLEVGRVPATDGHADHIIFRTPDGHVFNTPQEAAAAGYLKVVDHGPGFAGESAVEAAKPMTRSEEILDTITNRKRGVAAAIMGSDLKSLSEQDQEKLGSELMEVRRAWLTLKEGTPGTPQYAVLQERLKFSLAHLQSDYGKDLPKGWQTILMRGEGAVAMDDRGGLATEAVSSHHDAVLEAVGARERTLASAIMGKGLERLNVAEQKDLAHQLASLRHNAELLAKDPDSIKFQKAFDGDLAKLEKDFHGKLPSNWQETLVSPKTATAMSEASGSYATAPAPHVDVVQHTETVQEGDTTLTKSSTEATLIGVTGEQMRETLLNDGVNPVSRVGFNVSTFRTLFEMKLRALYAANAGFDSANPSMKKALRTQLELLARDTTMTPQQLFKPDLLKKAGLT